MVKIDKDFESRNWMLLGRLSKMGFEPEEAKKIVNAIEDHKITFREVEKIGERNFKKVISPQIKWITNTKEH